VQYDDSLEREYFAFRNSAGLLDVSPLYKYDILGKDAEKLLDRMMTRNIRKLKVGQVAYCPWCDEQGELIHDGNLVRLSPNHFRLTAADPVLRWLEDVGYGMDVKIGDISQAVAGLALQGPKSRAILQKAMQGIDFATLPYFGMAHGTLDGHAVMVTRTGFTGDLGYELWLDPRSALAIWDRLMEIGRSYGILPVGLGALDMVRLEAGLVLIGVDYISAPFTVIDAQRSNPFETGMGKLVRFEKESDFIGKAALQKVAAAPEWQLVGLAVAWQELERLWDAVDLRPTVVGRGTSRQAVPVFAAGSNSANQIGQMTSHLFSPLLKQYIGLGTLKTEHATFGTQVEVEMTVEYSRVLATATIVPLPFYEPAWKKS
jgi:aminomethyltransferase